ncbi:MAG TPA: aldo/keto reductase [Mycobacteriales bacterium]|nr:aldo/keto reductase [Mycobacteriales bacterium]
MTDRTLAWGIIGPGNIARKFAGQLPMSKTGHLAAVGSRRLESAKSFGEEFGAKRWYGDYESVLADDEVDAVYISTPHPMHAEWAVKAAEAGKHVLVEKPLSLSHAWSMAVIEAARKHDVFLMEAYMYRCHPQTQRLVELIRSGAVGAVHQIEASFAFAAGFNPDGRLFDPALGGGGILDVGGYPVSIARLIAGAAVGADFADPVDVTAVGRLGESGIDEWTTATLRFNTGITAHVTTGVRLAAENVVRVIGSEGYLLVSDPWLPSPTEATKIVLHRAGADVEEIVVEPAGLYAAEADTVAAHVAERQAPAMSWADSLGNMKTLDLWRAEIGLQYPAERGDADIPTVSGRPLARQDGNSMQYGEIAGVGKPISRLVMGVDNQPNLPHATVMFDDFVERGGNTFDTAYIYGGGKTEPLLGQWMRNRGNRDELVVIGKGAHTPHCDPESITRQLNESLERLQTDYLDIYFMHRDNEEIPVGEFVDVLDDHQRAGRIRIYGGSNWSLQRFAEANEYAKKNGKQGFSALSNHISLAEAYDVPWKGCRHVSDPESRRWLAEHQVPLLPWSSQARGFFTGRADPQDRSDEELVRCYYSDDNFERLRRARKLGSELGVPPTAIALAYVLYQPFPTFPLIGPRAVEETRTSLAALDITLTPEQVSWLDLSDRG